MHLSKAFSAALLAASVAMAQQPEMDQQPQKKAMNNFGVGIHAAFNYNTMFGLDDDWNIYSDSEQHGQQPADIHEHLQCWSHDGKLPGEEGTERSDRDDRT